MTAPGCERLALSDLTDYAAGELPEAEAAALEEHLFSCAACAARAAELDVLVRAIRAAVRSAEVGGFVTDAVLNRLARDGVRVRTWVSPMLGPAAAGGSSISRPATTAQGVSRLVTPRAVGGAEFPSRAEPRGAVPLSSLE